MTWWLRYARHADILRLEAEGWKVVADLGDTHRCYSVLMQFMGEGKP